MTTKIHIQRNTVFDALLLFLCGIGIGFIIGHEVGWHRGFDEGEAIGASRVIDHSRLRAVPGRPPTGLEGVADDKGGE